MAQRMGENDNELRSGDWVQVRDPLEISQTLNANGTLDGLPFMPEMLELCGRRFRVLRRAEKTCLEKANGAYSIREFHRNDVVLLEALRCSGAGHDGCQRQCMLFWKAAWLRKVENEQPLRAVEQSRPEQLLPKMKTKVSPNQYFCQSTELAKATRPLTRFHILLKCFYEIRSGSRGILEMGGLILAPLWRKATQRIPRRRLRGELKRTPVGDLKLQSGEWVEIQAAAEIAKTLDHRGRNRGLLCDFGMCQYSGGQYQVRNRLDRMISESTGEMRQVDSTVILEGLHCLCPNVFGGCPRNDFMYWREVWLKRAIGARPRVEICSTSPQQDRDLAAVSGNQVQTEHTDRGDDAA